MEILAQVITPVLNFSTQQLCPLVLSCIVGSAGKHPQMCFSRTGYFSMNGLKTTACVSFVAEADQSEAKIFQKQSLRARHFIGALLASCNQRRRWFTLDFARQHNETSPQLCGDAKNVPAETPSQNSQGRRRNLQLRILPACSQHISVPKLKELPSN